MLVVDWSVAPQSLAVVTAEADFGTAMAMQTHDRGATVYEFVCTTNCHIKQGTAPLAATTGAGSKYCPANIPVYLSPKDGVNLSAIRATADGTATLTLMRRV